MKSESRSVAPLRSAMRRVHWPDQQKDLPPVPLDSGEQSPVSTPHSTPKIAHARFVNLASSCPTVIHCGQAVRNKPQTSRAERKRSDLSHHRSSLLLPASSERRRRRWYKLRCTARRLSRNLVMHIPYAEVTLAVTQKNLESAVLSSTRNSLLELQQNSIVSTALPALQSQKAVTVKSLEDNVSPTRQSMNATQLPLVNTAPKSPSVGRRDSQKRLLSRLSQHALAATASRLREMRSKRILDDDRSSDLSFLCCRSAMLEAAMHNRNLRDVAIERNVSEAQDNPASPTSDVRSQVKEEHEVAENASERSTGGTDERTSRRHRARTVLVAIMSSLDSVQDLMNLMSINKGMYDVFQEHKGVIVDNVRCRESLSPAGELTSWLSHPFLSEQQDQQQQQVSWPTALSCMQTLARSILEHCGHLLTADQHKHHRWRRNERMWVAMCRVWSFCCAFGGNSEYKGDTTAHLDWLRGGLIAFDLSCPACGTLEVVSESILLNPPTWFGVGNGKGLSIEAARDMKTVWYCMRHLLAGYESKLELARKSSFARDLQEWHTFLDHQCSLGFQSVNWMFSSLPHVDSAFVGLSAVVRGPQFSQNTVGKAYIIDAIDQLYPRLREQGNESPRAITNDRNLHKRAASTVLAIEISPKRGGGSHHMPGNLKITLPINVIGKIDESGDIYEY